MTDTGGGIEDNDIEKLFDPFFSSKFVGRGMGLPAVLGIVRAHKGAITVESNPGRGSSFRIFFPVSTDVPTLEHRNDSPEVLRQPDKVGKNDDVLSPIERDRGGTA
ncbi:MAG: ATP-binding protein [Deltaproteobacteria bacterium]